MLSTNNAQSEVFWCAINCYRYLFFLRAQKCLSSFSSQFGTSNGNNKYIGVEFNLINLEEHLLEVLCRTTCLKGFAIFAGNSALSRSSTKAVYWICSIKKLFLKISQNAQENTCKGVSFLKVFQEWGLQLYWKWDFHTSVFLWVLQSF